MPAPAGVGQLHAPVVLDRLRADRYSLSADHRQRSRQLVGPVNLMRRKPILAAIVVLALAGARVYYYGGGSVPSAPRPLYPLPAPNPTAHRNAFYSARGDV